MFNRRKFVGAMATASLSSMVTGDPLKTQLNRPHGVFVHPSGALYISDSYNHRVLKLSN
jgi:hypothetical protein